MLFRVRSPFFIIAGVAVLLLIGYFSVNLISAYSAPGIIFDDGGSSFETTERVHTFRGRTHPEADLTMNGRIVYLNEDGSFAERVLFAREVNEMEFVAKNRLGKVSKVVRYVVVK